MNEQPIRHGMSKTPSRIRIRKMGEGVRARQSARRELFEDQESQNSRPTVPRKGAVRRLGEFGVDILKPMAPLLAMGALAVGVMTSRDNQAPVDPLRLPADE